VWVGSGDEHAFNIRVLSFGKLVCIVDILSACQTDGYERTFIDARGATIYNPSDVNVVDDDDVAYLISLHFNVCDADATSESFATR